MNRGQILANIRAKSASIATSRWNDATLGDFVNDAQIQLALEVDFPEATLYFPTNPPPSVAPTLAVVGTPGTTQVTYAYAAIAQVGGVTTAGDSSPSPVTSIANAPSTLTTGDYVSVTFPTTPGVSYRVLRQYATEPFASLIATVVASGASTTFVDNGTATPVFYAMQRGNEFELPELTKIIRAYMYTNQGQWQPLVPTNIDLLEGVTTEEWDQSSGMVLGAPQYTPRALAEQPTIYPVPSPFGRAPVKSTWQFVSGGGQRPEWYMRGGFFGLLPPPSSIYQIRLDYTVKPPALNLNSDTSIFPDIFKDAIVFKVLADMMMGNDNSRDQQYMQSYMNECQKLRDWKARLQVNAPTNIVPIPIRTQMREWST